MIKAVTVGKLGEIFVNVFFAEKFYEFGGKVKTAHISADGVAVNIKFFVFQIQQPRDLLHEIPVPLFAVNSIVFFEKFPEFIVKLNINAVLLIKETLDLFFNALIPSLAVKAVVLLDIIIGFKILIIKFH